MREKKQKINGKSYLKYMGGILGIFFGLPLILHYFPYRTDEGELITGEFAYFFLSICFIIYVSHRVSEHFSLEPDNSI